MTPEQLEIEAELLYLEQRPRHDSSLCWCCGQSMLNAGRISLVRCMEGAQRTAHKQCAVKYGENQRMPMGPRWADVSHIGKAMWRARVAGGELAELG